MYRDENRQNHETEPNTYPISGQCTTRVARASEGCSSNGKKTASSPLHDVSDVDGAQLLSKRFFTITYALSVKLILKLRNIPSTRSINSFN